MCNSRSTRCARRTCTRRSRPRVQAAAEAGVNVTVGRLSTFAAGDDESVFAALRAAFTAAKSFGPTVMVVTLSSGLPSEGTVAEIQGALDN